MQRTTRVQARSRLAELLGRLKLRPGDDDAAWDAADIAMDYGFEEEAAPAVERAAQMVRSNAGLWQMLGLLHRSADEMIPAIAALEKARQLAPDRPKIAHALALSLADAGRPSLERYDEAIALAPGDGTIRLGKAAAQVALGQLDQAAADLSQLLLQSPGWIDGHSGFAKLAAMTGDPAGATATIDRALQRFPTDQTLHLAKLGILARTAEPEQRLNAIEKAVVAAAGLHPSLAKARAIALSDANQIAAADRAFEAIADDGDHGFALSRVRHALRAHRPDQVELLSEQLIDTTEAVTAWAYRATAWRLVGDERLDWLFPPQAISSQDISAELPPLDKLAELLRTIHTSRAQPIDQSVRGGTQTDGPLFARVEPEIRAVRDAVRRAIRRYVDSLPPRDAGHPLLGPERDQPVRFSGSWSVRLGRSGRHANHVHQNGWLSSALYIRLPAADGEIGRLELGAPSEELGLAMEPTRTIRPQEGNLVLFPSTQWHGTMAIADGERLTIAFDVARPYH